MNTDTFRARHGLPTSDAALVYELLRDHDLGVPITTLAVFLEVHPTNLRRVWDVVHEVQDLYNVEIGKRGSSLPVIYLKNSHWGELQDLCYHRRLKKIRSGELVKVTSEKSKEPKPRKPRIRQRVKPERPDKWKQNRREILINVVSEYGLTITANEVVDVHKCTRQNAGYLLKKWIKDGYLKIPVKNSTTGLIYYEVDPEILEIEIVKSED